MVSRYTGKRVIVNDAEEYKEFMRRRGVKFIQQHSFNKMSQPDVEDLDRLEVVGHIWKIGDRLYKLAYEHYGDVSLWWVIAWFNQIPTEAHIELGDVIDIPHPIDDVLKIARV